AYGLEEQHALGIAVVVGSNNAPWFLRALFVKQVYSSDTRLGADEINDAVLRAAGAADHDDARVTIGKFERRVAVVMPRAMHQIARPDLAPCPKAFGEV